MRISVRLPRELQERLEHAARARGTTRGELIVQACRAYLDRPADTWPEGWFDPLAEREQSELDEATRELDEAVSASRRNRRNAPK